MFDLRPSVRSALIALVGVVATFGCGRATKLPAFPAGAAPLAVRPEPASSTVVVARLQGRRVALVADEDAHAILRVDLDDRRELAPIALDATPGAMLLLADGRLLVASKDRRRVDVVAVDSLEGAARVSGKIDTPAEPTAMTVSPDGRTIYIASGWGRSLTAVSERDYQRKFEIPLAREPRSIVAADDGKRLFVAHAVGSRLSVVDVSQPKPDVRMVALRGDTHIEPSDIEDLRASLPDAKGKEKKDLQKTIDGMERKQKDGLPSCQSFVLAKSSALPGRVFVPEVMVDPGNAEQKSDGYGSGDGESEVPSVAVLDESTAAPLKVSLTRPRETVVDGQDTPPEPGTCLLPRAAVIDDRSRLLLVACRGIDAVVAYDASSAAPANTELRRWHVGAGPSGIAVDTERRQAVVWSQFDRTLSVLSLAEPAASPNGTARMAMTPLKDPLEEGVALGRMLFHRTADPRISSDGRACASCHPDGRDDAITWSTPEGPRRSIMLAGRLSDTAPFSWQGNASTVHKHLTSTFQRLGGTGLAGLELEALVTYVHSLSRPVPRTEGAPDARVIAGAKIFTSTKAGCAGCHSGPAYTDGKMHDVGSGRRFNTPSLLQVGSAGPYFHDGRYASLADLLEKSDGKMGRTSHLKPEEIDALEAFLRAL